jgi:hypothetical protein
MTATGAILELMLLNAILFPAQLFPETVVPPLLCKSACSKEVQTLIDHVRKRDICFVSDAGDRFK